MKLKKYRSTNDMELSIKLDYYRGKISHGIFIFLSIFSLTAYVPSIILAIKTRDTVVILFDTLIYIFILLMVLNKRINYKFKGVVTLIAFYLLGIFLMYNYGYSSTGNLWFFTLNIISALLLGTKASVVTIVFSTVVYLAFIPLIELKITPWSNLNSNTLRIWIIHAGTYLLLSSAISLSLAIYLSGFSKTLSHVFSTKKATILGLAKLAEHRDTDTGSHILRLQQYSSIISNYLYRYHNFDGYITKEYLEDIKISSVLHDIGKVGIQDSILLKPGKLNKQEFEEMKQHTVLGGEVISEIEKNIKGRTIYTIGKEIALYHHEKWDGSGYPFGLKGESIPLSARIISIVDVYDALTTKRPYKEPMSHDDALFIITESSGKHFDPLMVEALIMNEADFKAISDRYLSSYI